MSLSQMSLSQMSLSQMSVSQMSVGQMYVGQLSVSQMSVGKMPVGQMVIDNCTLHDLVLAGKEVLHVLEFESEQCVPLDDNTVSLIISNSEQKFPKFQKKSFPNTKLNKKPIEMLQMNSSNGTLTFCTSTKLQ